MELQIEIPYQVEDLSAQRAIFHGAYGRGRTRHETCYKDQKDDYCRKEDCVPKVLLWLIVTI